MTNARLSLLLSSHLKLQGKDHVWIPLIVMGIISVASGVADSFLPETLHENLPQTIEDGDSFGRKQKFFSLAQKRKKSETDLEKSQRLSDFVDKTSLVIPREMISTKSDNNATENIPISSTPSEHPIEFVINSSVKSNEITGDHRLGSNTNDSDVIT
jgi:hypothetical protein